MSMRYFQNAGSTYGYDTAVATDAPLIAAAIAAGWTEVTGNWPLTPAPTPAQTGQAAIAAGLAISSTGSSQINGIYGCDPTSVANFNAIETYVLRNNAFPNNAASQPWVLLNGSIVSIPSITVFNNLATALANYVAAVQVYIYSNGEAGSLPAASTTIP